MQTFIVITDRAIKNMAEYHIIASRIFPINNFA